MKETDAQRTILAIDPGPVKRCTKCKQERLLTEFYKNKQTFDRLGVWCKPCEKARDRKSYTKKYRETENYVSAQKKYKTSEKKRKSNRDYHRKIRELQRKKVIAREAINSAIRHGRLARPETCSQCGDKGLIHGHHHDYNKPMDVQWLCVICHAKAHGKMLDK